MTSPTDNAALAAYTADDYLQAINDMLNRIPHGSVERYLVLAWADMMRQAAALTASQAGGQEAVAEYHDNLPTAKVTLPHEVRNAAPPPVRVESNTLFEEVVVALRTFVDRYDKAQPADPHEIGLLHRHFKEARAVLAKVDEAKQHKV